MVVLANIVHLLFQIYTFIVFIHVILSYFLSPYHPVREFIDRMVDPLLQPIRRVVPPMGMFDFSPLVLLILLQIVDTLVVRLLLMAY